MIFRKQDKNIMTNFSLKQFGIKLKAEIFEAQVKINEFAKKHFGRNKCLFTTKMFFW